MVVRQELLLSPDITPLTGGVLEQATVLEDALKLQRPGVGLFESFNCMPMDNRADWPCATDDDVDGDSPKTFPTGAAWPEGKRGVLYGGLDCKRFGERNDQARLIEVFEARESFGVEGLLMETVLQGAVDITPVGGAVSPRVGVALLEGHAAGTYAGVPTLHLPRTIASLLAGDQVIESQGGKLYTRLGAKVAAGGGYDVSNIGPDGTPADPGTFWLYASGEVVIGRSKLFAKDALDMGQNISRDLIERAYLLAVDCYTSAVLVNVE